MKKWIAWVVIASLVVLVAAAWAAVGTKRLNSTRVGMRAYNGATPLQYDTLTCRDGRQIELMNFNVFADDSANTPTLWVTFMSSNSKTVYLRLQQAYTANQVLVTNWVGPWVFPKDSTILAYYNVLGGASWALDTMIVNATYTNEVP